MSYPPSAPGGAYPSEGPSHPSSEAPTQSYPAAGQPESPTQPGSSPAATQPPQPAGTGPSATATQPLPAPGQPAPGQPAPGYPAAPVSGPSYPSAPVSGTGYPAGPVSGAGYPPVSGAGYPAVSGPGYAASPVMAPTSAMPTVDAPFGAPSAKRRPVVPVLAALTVLFFLATAVVTGLYLSKSSDYKRTRAQVADQQKTISDQGKKIDGLSSDLQSTKDQLSKTQQDLTGTKNTADELQHEKQVISNCFNLLGEAAQAANQGDRATYNAKMKEANPVCDEADKYLG